MHSISHPPRNRQLVAEFPTRKCAERTLSYPIEARKQNNNSDSTSTIVLLPIILLCVSIVQINLLTSMRPRAARFLRKELAPASVTLLPIIYIQPSGDSQNFPICSHWSICCVFLSYFHGLSASRHECSIVSRHRRQMPLSRKLAMICAHCHAVHVQEFQVTVRR